MTTALCTGTSSGVGWASLETGELPHGGVAIFAADGSNQDSGEEEPSNAKKEPLETAPRETDEAVNVGPMSRAAQLIGMPIVNGKDQKLGKLYDIVLDWEKGRIAYGVLSTGGVLGIGKKLLAIPYQALMPHPSESKLVLDRDLSELVEAKGLEAGNWPAPGTELKSAIYQDKGAALDGANQPEESGGSDEGGQSEAKEESEEP